jgi:TRAP-type C4-dicarboxylate transport system permease small subunit
LRDTEGSLEPENQTSGGGDRAADAFDRVSATVSKRLFELGTYVIMPALVVLVTTDVALRYIFNAPLQWARDVNGILLIIALMCAMPHAWDRSYHIRMEVFYTRFTMRHRKMADVLSAVSGIIFFGFMAVQATRFVPFMIRTGETGEDWDFVLWPFMAVVSFCAFVMVARVFSNPAGEERGKES